MLDIYLNFRTGFMREASWTGLGTRYALAICVKPAGSDKQRLGPHVWQGHLVDDDWVVFKAYLKGAFTMDVLGTFPISIVTMVLNPDNPYGDEQISRQIAADAAESGAGGVDPGRANRMLRLMRMAKLAKLARMRKLAKAMESFEEYLNPGVLAVIKLVMISLFCCHLFGSLWWMVSDMEITEAEEGGGAAWYTGENSWHPPLWVREENSLTMKYAHSFYWHDSLDRTHINSPPWTRVCCCNLNHTTCEQGCRHGHFSGAA